MIYRANDAKSNRAANLRINKHVFFFLFNAIIPVERNLWEINRKGKKLSHNHYLIYRTHKQLNQKRHNQRSYDRIELG